MNITDIKLCSQNAGGADIVHATFSLQNPSRDQPYIIKAATGLDAEEIIKTYNDGWNFFRVTPAPRVVSILIKLNPDYAGQVTVGDLRDHLYRAISFNTSASDWNRESLLELQFFNGVDYVASLQGRITKLEASLFTAEPEVQLSIECQHPFLESKYGRGFKVFNNPTPRSYLLGSDPSDLYSFPISATFQANDTFSTAPHGFAMDVEVTSPQPRFIIFDRRLPEKYFFFVIWDFEVGDVIRITSLADGRNCQVDRNGVRHAYLNDRFLWGSIWTFMLPGLNTFDVSAGMRIKFAAYRDTYWGI